LLGDRTLTAFVGNDGVYALATYTYTNLNAAGNPNVFKLVRYNKDLTEWHFIYFAYTRKERRAFGYI
jgi:hypothetical protein